MLSDFFLKYPASEEKWKSFNTIRFFSFPSSEQLTEGKKEVNVWPDKNFLEKFW